MTTQRTLTAVYQRSGDWWAAWVEELPGANTQGATLDEARENLREAVALILEEEQRDSEQAQAVEVVISQVIREPLIVTV
jgi:predicted RNase H-like HicB family nuclease